MNVDIYSVSTQCIRYYYCTIGFAAQPNESWPNDRYRWISGDGFGYDCNASVSITTLQTRTQVTTQVHNALR